MLNESFHGAHYGLFGYFIKDYGLFDAGKEDYELFRLTLLIFVEAVFAMTIVNYDLLTD